MQTSAPLFPVNRRTSSGTSPVTPASMAWAAPSFTARPSRSRETSTAITCLPSQVCIRVLPRPMGPIPKTATQSTGSFRSLVEVW